METELEWNRKLQCTPPDMFFPRIFYMYMFSQNSLVDSRYDAPDVVIHLQALQLGIAVTHRTTPSATLTIHLQVCLQIKTLKRRKKYSYTCTCTDCLMQLVTTVAILGQ